jgi:site-specific recombinase XerD
MHTATDKPDLIVPSFASYVEDRKYLKNVSPKTLTWFVDAWKAFGPHLEPALANGGRLPDALKAAVLTLLEKGVRPVSVNSYLTCARAYLNWLHSEGHLREKPKVQLLKFEHKVLATFSPEHVEALLTLKPKGRNQARAHVICSLLLDSGLRISEALNIRREQIDFENLLIRVTGKGNKQRLVPMSLELRKQLFRWLQRCPKDFVFGTRCGTKMTVRNFQRDFKAICVKLKITDVRCSPHTLRHTFAVSYLRAGGNLFYLSKILGHTSVKTTERYLQSLEPQDLQAVHDRLSLLTLRLAPRGDSKT